MTAPLTATGVLARLAVRRDRVRLTVWLLALAALVGSTASAIEGLYATPAAVAENAATRASSVVARAFTGPATGGNVGALAVAEALVFTCVLAALMNVLTVVRHTRQNEELGRAELIGSTAVGRHAGLVAALLMAGVADVLLAGACAVALLANGLPVAGSLAAGAAVGASGLAFAGITAVAAQVAEGARGAIGLASAALGLAYLLRAVGDATGDIGPDGMTVTATWPSWLSPIGWAQRLEPFGDERWWPLGLFALFTALVLGLAGWLNVHRDVGTGMIPVRRGRTRAARSLCTPFGLAWRLQRGMLLGWLVGVALFGLAFGGIGDQVDDLFGSEQSAELMRQLGGGGSLVDAYFAAMMGLMGVIVAGYTLQALLRLRTDETGGPTEAVLATGVSRTRWVVAHVLVALVGTVLVLLALGLGTGLAYGVVAGDLGDAVGDLLVTTLAQLAPTLVLAGFVVAVFGLVPRAAAALAWAAFGVCLVVGQFGALLELPRAVIDLSPFSHLPDLPAQSLTAGPLAALTGLSVLLLMVGLVGFRRRSLTLQ
ncbi:MAG TPA: ABC transporter permease [Actinophytocola sp.]|nr:ABC transporter permease [Actinophytocola sp.]